MLRTSLPAQVRLKYTLTSTVYSDLTLAVDVILFFFLKKIVRPAFVLIRLLFQHVITDEPAAWAYLCDLLSALQHLHSHGFVHLDLKPANVLMTDSGRLKLGDFGLLLELKNNSTGPLEGKLKDDVQEGDPRYMAPELLRGEYGPAADVFRYCAVRKYYDKTEYKSVPLY